MQHRTIVFHPEPDSDMSKSTNTTVYLVENSIPKNNDRRQSHIWKSRVTNVFPLNTRVIKLLPQYSV
jgi:K+-transporting ATPase c subunit